MDKRKHGTMSGRGTTPDGSKAERRKTFRFLVAVPIEASWRNAEACPVLVQAVAKQVNVNGGFLEMTIYPSVGSRITLTNFLSAESAEARVLATPDFQGRRLPRHCRRADHSERKFLGREPASQKDQRGAAKAGKIAPGRRYRLPPAERIPRHCGYPSHHCPGRPAIARISAQGAAMTVKSFPCW